MGTKTHNLTVKVSLSDYSSVIEGAKSEGASISGYVRNCITDKQNSLAIFEEFDRRIKVLEDCINNNENNLKQLFKSNDTKLIAIYKVLKSLSTPENNQGNRHD